MVEGSAYREDRRSFAGLDAAGSEAQWFLPASQIPSSQTEPLIGNYLPAQSRKSAGSPTERKEQSKRTLRSFRKEKRSWYITPSAKRKMARDLSSPKRSKNFCWLGCTRVWSTVVTPSASDSFFSKEPWIGNYSTHRQVAVRISPP